PRRGRRGSIIGILAGALYFAGTIPSTRAHGDDQLLIDALTEELAKAPEADLFIRRGELFRHHQEWAKAGADFESAARLEPKLEIVAFFRARLLLESGEPAKARAFIDRYLAGAPGEAEGWFLRGDVLGAIGKHEAGALDYAEGIRRASHPRPEHFLRRAKFLAAAPEATPTRVLAAVDEGIAKLGPVISLLEYAIALELERKNYEGALVRIQKAMEHSPRRETWLVRRGDILLKFGRTSEAVAAYRAALAAIEELPPRYRETVPVEKLERDARASLGQISSR
ncbi:MAG: tetratricopeptide repeat protein, partial [Opitutaceae bacterium]